MQFNTVKLDLEEFRGMFPGLAEEKASDMIVRAQFEALKGILADEEGRFPYPESHAKTIVYHALCHLVTLMTDDNPNAGRIASVSEGAVSVSYENLPSNSDNGQFWNLTKCGALFWVMARSNRTRCRAYVRHRHHPWG